jgi:hypothetical protein
MKAFLSLAEMPASAGSFPVYRAASEQRKDSHVAVER